MRMLTPRQRLPWCSDQKAEAELAGRVLAVRLHAHTHVVFGLRLTKRLHQVTKCTLHERTILQECRINQDRRIPSG
jgi:hypothetical protein